MINEMSSWKWYVNTDEGEEVLIVDAPFGSMCMYMEDLTPEQVSREISVITEKMWGMLDGIMNEQRDLGETK